MANCLITLFTLFVLQSSAAVRRSEKEINALRQSQKNNVRVFGLDSKVSKSQLKYKDKKKILDLETPFRATDRDTLRLHQSSHQKRPSELEIPALQRKKRGRIKRSTIIVD